MVLHSRGISGEGAGKRVPTNPASAGPQVVGKHRDGRCRPPPHSCGIIVRLAGLLTQHGLLRLQSCPASFERDCLMSVDSGRSDRHSIHVQGVHVSAVQRERPSPSPFAPPRYSASVAMRGAVVWTLIPAGFCGSCCRQQSPVAVGTRCAFAGG